MKNKNKNKQNKQNSRSALAASVSPDCAGGDTQSENTHHEYCAKWFILQINGKKHEGWSCVPMCRNRGLYSFVVEN